MIESATGIPVIIAGGPRISDKEMLNNIYGAIKAGGSGCCIGRNGFNRENTTDFVKAIRAIVHENKSVDQALELLQ